MEQGMMGILSYKKGNIKKRKYIKTNSEVTANKLPLTPCEEEENKLTKTK